MNETNEKKKPLPIMTARTLQQLPTVAAPYIVHGLLRTGRKRTSLLLGSPHDGKSTLAWFLAVCVCKGVPFLGRKTERSEVLFWNSEEDVQDVKVLLDRLGYDAETDMPLHIFHGMPNENNVFALRDALRERPNVRLVIIETLDSLLQVEEILGNTQSRDAFDKFDNHVVGEFHLRVCFLSLHHLRKNESGRANLMILGATEIAARTDACLFIRRVSDTDPRRVFNTDLRHGDNIAPTYLEFDAATGRSALGNTVSEEQKAGLGNVQRRILADILKYSENHPDEPLNLNVITGNADDKKRVLKKALLDGLLMKSGKGTRNSPYLYRRSGIVAEVAEVRGIATLEQQFGEAA